MGVMSRRVMPVCDNLCIFCPSLRPRSRQPVKRYKKLLAEIFPRNQDAEPNDRKIGKLCEYASKNPLRIPKITEYLEQRSYKDLRIGNFGSVKVVLCIYRKLLSSCKAHLSLFASSLLGIVRTLLEQPDQYELQSLACMTLVDFMNCQVDGTYMFNLEGLIPKLCQMAGDIGDDDRALCLRSAGMQALGCMVLFMGEHSHISLEFDEIISVMLENYAYLQPCLESRKEEMQNSLYDHPEIGEDLKVDSNSSPADINKQLSIVVANNDVDPTVDTAKNPSYWSRVCLRNMARLAKEAATVRHVLEPLLQKFDAENHWSINEGLGYSILVYLLLLLEESGANSDQLFSILVKHLDHKNVAGKPQLQIDILKVTTLLARNAKRRSSVTLVGLVADLIKQLRRCLQSLAEGSSAGGVIDKNKTDLQTALESCISELANIVEDTGPILDMMAVILESIPAAVVAARSTIFAVYRAAQIISSVPNVSYDKKAFPDALFHQLLHAMAHPDHETRVGAHSVLSIVLVPSMLSQKRKHVESLPVSTSVKALNGGSSPKGDKLDMNVQIEELNHVSDTAGKKYLPLAFHSESCYFKLTLADGKMERTSLRLNSHQVSLLLSSIWAQAISAENTPANFEAMAHTYSMAVLFTRSKNPNHAALGRCFQLALSLRSISLEVKGCLHPSRRRSLFTLASYMLIFSARADDLQKLIPLVKASLTDKTADPYLKLVEDIRLQAVFKETNAEAVPYGSKEDEAAALDSLSAIASDNGQLRDIILSHLVTKNSSLPKDEVSLFKEQFLQEFSPDEQYALGTLSFMETSNSKPCSPLGHANFEALDEVEPLDYLSDDDDGHPELGGSQSGRKSSPSSISADVLNVSQLMESVHEAARHVASVTVSSSSMSYDEMTSQCEALVSGKQQKMLVLQSFKNQYNSKAIVPLGAITTNNKEPTFPNSKMEFSEEDLKLINIEQPRGGDQGLSNSNSNPFKQYSFKLPPASPYDKFLKAAGC